MKHEIVIVGGGAVGETLAGVLTRAGADVVYLDDDSQTVERAVASGVDARRIEQHEAAALDDVGVDRPDIALVASREDSWNLLIAQLLQLRCADRIVALVNDPNNVDVFTDAGVESVCVTSVLVSALAERRTTGPSTGDA